MDNNLQLNKYSLLTQEEQNNIAKYLANEHEIIIKVGMQFYNNTYHCIGVIVDLFYKNDILMISYQINKYDRGNEIYTETITDFLHFRHNQFIYSSIEDFEQDVNDLVSNAKNIQQLMLEKFGNYDLEESNSTDLMIVNKNSIVDKRDELIMKRQFVAARLEKLSAVLDNKRRELMDIVSNFKHSIEKINKLVLQLELYLGIEETIEQIQVGIPAPINLPISLRQRIMYMDVEIGDPSDGGLDINSIEQFDEWLLKYHSYWKKKNYEILIPEEKCIAIFRIRHKDKKYNFSSNPFLNALFSAGLNDANMNTYIFIRNGENIYKIWSNKINIIDRLFPRKKELNELLEELSKGNYSGKKADEKLHHYKLHFLMIQGILERTPIFPNSNEIKLFDTTVDNSEKIQYIYDDEIGSQLPSGIPTFNQWKNNLNKSISEGSRIYFIQSLFTRKVGYGNEGDVIRRKIFKQFFWKDYSYPENPPKTGLYIVYNETDKKFVGNTEQLYIKYAPSKRDYYYDEVKREKRYSFAIEVDEEWLLNYDAISYKDMELLEFYMYTRIGREAYLEYIPLLMEVYKSKKAELEKEQEFVKLLLGTLNYEETQNNKDLVMEKIEWWKIKNKWKRSLNTDDAKAFRMILKELKNEK